MQAETKATTAAQGWLPGQDSNLDKEIQSLRCYRYTTRQSRAQISTRPSDAALSEAGLPYFVIRGDPNRLGVKCRAKVLNTYVEARSHCDDKRAPRWFSRSASGRLAYVIPLPPDTLIERPVR